MLVAHSNAFMAVLYGLLLHCSVYIVKITSFVRAGVLC